jgi:hypothetical protein
MMITYNAGYTGWLGNQMFQYAAVRALGLRLNSPIFFPTKNPDLTEIFNIPHTSLIEGEYSSYVEPHFHYKEIPKIDENMILFGYYQSEKYFKDFADVILKDFEFKYPPHRDIQSNTTSIHVRRGDYLNLPDHHPVCSVEYYKEAMSFFPNQKFLVFSNDLDWCKEHINGDNIEYSEGLSPAEDLQLMILCDNHIIANSSFSWWGAWLGHNKDKKVIAPSKWFGSEKSFNTSDLYCEGWTVV